MIGLLKYSMLVKPIARVVRAADRVVTEKNSQEIHGGNNSVAMQSRIENLESAFDLLFEAAERIGISRADLISEINNQAG